MFAALAAGGDLRVGMEDTSDLRPRPPGDRELRTRAARRDRAELAQRPAMSPEQARAMLGVARQSREHQVLAGQAGAAGAGSGG